MIVCPCGQKLRLPEGGSRGKCPRCGRIVGGRRRSKSGQRSFLPWVVGLAVANGILVAGWVVLLRRTDHLEDRISSLARRSSPEVATNGAGPGHPREVKPPTARNAVPDIAGLREEVRRLSKALENLREQSKRERVDRLPADESPQGFEDRLIRLARRAIPSIVSIQRPGSIGSGVIATPDGYILTNAHVVGNEQEVRVQLSNGAVYRGRVLGKDYYSDVACVRIDATGLPAMAFGDSESLQVGQVVAALGNPFGISRDGSPTVTLGIVSALHRVIPLGQNREYRDAIQTDAAINPGNSGGALVDLQGRLIGINGAISSRTGANSGVGFAIPVNFVKKVFGRLKAGESTEPGFLGIRVGELTAEQIRRVGGRGVLVATVLPGSPAEKAGMKAGDVILGFEGKKVENTTRLLNLISYYQVGETVRIDLWRNGKRMRLSVTIGRMPG